jgi:hypothetical protein
MRQAFEGSARERPRNREENPLLLARNADSRGKQCALLFVYSVIHAA